MARQTTRPPKAAPSAVAAPAPAIVTERPAKEWALLVAVALATVLAPLNSTMIAVALPRIMTEFGADIASAGWLVTGYLIAMAALQPVAGTLGDRLDRRGLVLGGLAIFGLASLGAVLAPNLGLLLVCRVLQGVAGAVALPNAVALVRAFIPSARRAAGFGLIGAAAGLAAALGPLLGGLAVQAGDWRGVFWLNLPLVALALAIGWRAFPTPPRIQRPTAFDLPGAVLLGATLLLGAVLLMRGRESGLALDPALIGVLLAGTTALLVWHERRHPAPVIPWRLFANRAFAAASGAIATSNLAMYVTLLALPLLLAAGAGGASMHAGVLLTALSGTMALTAPLGGRLADRFGRRWPVVAGLLLLTLGLLPLAVGSGAEPLPVLVAGLGLAGVGLGLSGAGLQTAAVEAVGPEAAGVAAGLFSTSRYLGSIVGSSLMAGLLVASGQGGFSAIFLVVLIAALVSMLISLALRDH